MPDNDIVNKAEEITCKLKDSEVEVVNGKKIGLNTKIVMTIKTFFMIIFALYSVLVTYGYMKQKGQIDRLRTTYKVDFAELNRNMESGFGVLEEAIENLRLEDANIKGDVKVIDDRTKGSRSRYERRTFNDNVPTADTEIPEEVTE